jgi:hypothetical protein
MTKPKKALHADLNSLIDFYEKQADFVGGGAQTATGELLATRAGQVRQASRQTRIGVDVSRLHIGSRAGCEALISPRTNPRSAPPLGHCPHAHRRTVSVFVRQTRRSVISHTDFTVLHLPNGDFEVISPAPLPQDRQLRPFSGVA